MYEARAGEARRMIQINRTMTDKLTKINLLFGACLTVGNDSESITTKMGFDVPKGSPLAYQMSIIEGDFSICENLDTPVEDKIQPVKRDVEQLPAFPWQPLDVPINVPQEDINALNLKVTTETATDIFKQTKKQADSA